MKTTTPAPFFRFTDATGHEQRFDSRDAAVRCAQLEADEHGRRVVVAEMRWIKGCSVELNGNPRDGFAGFTVAEIYPA